MSQCKKITGLLPAYLDNAVTDAERQAVTAHLAICESCRAELAAIAAAGKALGRTFESGAGQIQPEPGSWPKLREKLTESSNRPERRPNRRRRLALALAPAALAIIVILILQPWATAADLPTTRVEPQPGDRVALSLGLTRRLSLDEMIQAAEIVVRGRVIEIKPSAEGTLFAETTVIYTDVVIQPLKYYWGPESDQIIVRVLGGKVDGRIMWAEGQPVFTQGETPLLLLSGFPPDWWNSASRGDSPTALYRVVGSTQGKFKYWWPGILTHDGWPSCIWAVRAKIADFHPE